MSVASNIRSLFVFGLGFTSGWVARSVAESPQELGVRLLAIAMSTKERVSQWAAIERDRLEDVVAEARSVVASKVPTSKRTSNGHGRATGVTKGDA